MRRNTSLSEVLYGTGELKGVKDAFLRGARTGAVMSGIDNIARAAGIRGMEEGTRAEEPTAEQDTAGRERTEVSVSAAL